MTELSDEPGDAVREPGAASGAAGSSAGPDSSAGSVGSAGSMGATIGWYVFVGYACVIAGIVAFVERKDIPDYDAVGRDAYFEVYHRWARAMLFTTFGQATLTLVVVLCLLFVPRDSSLRGPSRRWMALMGLVCFGSCAATFDDLVETIADF